MRRFQLPSALAVTPHPSGPSLSGAFRALRGKGRKPSPTRGEGGNEGLHFHVADAG